MNFFQFFIWGSWLLTIGAFWFQYKGWSPTEFGLVFSTMGIASLFMPTIAGIIADKWINTEKLYALFHLCGAILLFILPSINNPITFFWVDVYKRQILGECLTSHLRIDGHGIGIEN